MNIDEKSEKSSHFTLYVSYLLIHIIVLKTTIISHYIIDRQSIGQQTKKKIQPKFNRLFGNISRECLKEYGVTPERVLTVYTLNVNDREAKCYVACMLLRFNVTTRNGGYNDKALEQLMAKPNSNNEIPTNMKTAIAIFDKDQCERAVKFTKCIYAHRNEFTVKNRVNSSTSADRRRPLAQRKQSVRNSTT
ncbi:general odorant-binding protein 19d, partial [Aphis craccivora]